LEPKAFIIRVMQRKYTLALLSWTADYPDPDNWLPGMFTTGARMNFTGYSNPEFDRIVEEAMATPDPEQRLELWAEAQKIMVRDMPLIFISHPERLFLIKPWVKNLKPTAMDGMIPGDMFFSEVSLVTR
jgi:oligopeptide transport system substrate-binding protein